MDPYELLNTLYHDLANCVDNALINSDGINEDDLLEMTPYAAGVYLSPYGRGSHVSGLLRAISYAHSIIGDIDTDRIGTQWIYQYRTRRLPTYFYWVDTCMAYDESS